MSDDCENHMKQTISIHDYIFYIYTCFAIIVSNIFYARTFIIKYIYIYIYIYKRMMLYLLLMDFWDPSTAITMEGMILKNKPHLVTFHEFLSQPMNFSEDHFIYIYIYIYICVCVYLENFVFHKDILILNHWIVLKYLKSLLKNLIYIRRSLRFDLSNKKKRALKKIDMFQ